MQDGGMPRFRPMPAQTGCHFAGHRGGGAQVETVGVDETVVLFLS